MGGFQIEPTSDHWAGPGDSAGISDVVGDSRQFAKEVETARVKYRLVAAFSCSDDCFHDYIVGAGGRLPEKCDE